MSENNADFENGRLYFHNDGHMVGQRISGGCECSTNSGTDFWCWIGIWKVTNFTVMREWNSLFMNGCEGKSLISVMMKFLNSCQGVSNTSVCPGITQKNDATQMD